MLAIRRANERGEADHGWLKSFHTFSFAEYYDPQFMGFGPLRVINEDRVQPGHGFGTHAHNNMEIISYVIEGALEHKDSIGTGSIIRPGDVQRMTAGTGIRHSEFNHSASELVHFLQIWIVPKFQGLKPGYEQKSFSVADKHGQLRLVGSQDGRDGSVTIHQDMDFFATILGQGDETAHTYQSGRSGWIQVVKGVALVNGQQLQAGDGAAINAPGKLTIRGVASTECLLFDMAA
jgi:redox-sensitive bicupin YhaK (pirin superfamily)